MAGLTASQRELGWNVRILLKSGVVSCFAGFYQQDGLVTVADVRRELELCFVLDQQAGHPALIPRAAHNDGPIFMITLNENDLAAFPTPPAHQKAEYWYIQHDPAQCADARQYHSLTSPCVRPAGRPPRRTDPRYMPIGRSSDNPFIKTVPIRGKKRPRTASSSPSRSPSKGVDDICENDEFPETIIPREEATVIMSEFRQNVVGAGPLRCAITGKGSAWWANGLGPAVQAAHIVPQIHWNVYPYEQGAPPQDDTAALRDAWTQTWHMSNGVLLSSHIHQCFDARILSIDPDTRRIRVFMPYDMITEYHGKSATLPEETDLQALRHHYDMCCLENMAAKKQPGLSTWVRFKSPATAMSPVTPSADSPGDPSKKVQKPDTASGQGAAGEQDSKDSLGDTGQKDIDEDGKRVDIGMQERPTQQWSMRQPLSPPSSESGCKTWRLGGVLLTDERRVEQLRSKGWLIHEVGSQADDWASDGQSSDEEEQRGRPRKRRCFMPD
ncbi:hypothetical protein INS49_003107 [Diaporthe citri]|uniref:uncharacterized protein n=1 Tax=Diaporthe citri TaxID=83186 RepID=UPI001C818C30|nr:uncharacterized protein INS49_003107 [Diaporthe citri]KAG6368889.1 hypothetical protein INS49_003107 [Diaporthe citri]